MSEITDPIELLLFSQAKLQGMLGMAPQAPFTSSSILHGFFSPTWIPEEFLQSFGCEPGKKCLLRESCGWSCLFVSTVKTYLGILEQWNTMFDTIMVNTCHSPFFKTYRMHDTKSELQCKPQTLGDKDTECGFIN